MKTSALIISLIFAMAICPLPVSAQSTNMELEITNPSDKSVVSRIITVKGHSKNIGGNEILLFVYSPGADKWFFQDSASVLGNGDWKGTAYIGAEGRGDVGARFKITAVVMAQVPKGLSVVNPRKFPLAGTLSRSEVITVKRGR